MKLAKQENQSTIEQDQKHLADVTFVGTMTSNDEEAFAKKRNLDGLKGLTINQPKTIKNRFKRTLKLRGSRGGQDGVKKQKRAGAGEQQFSGAKSH